MAVVTGRNPVGPQRGRAVRVPGIYARYHQRAAEAAALGPVEREYDPRFDPDDMSVAESAEREAAYRRVMDEARARADRLAAERISHGSPIVGTLLSYGLRPRNVPLLRDPDVVVDIDCGDWVTVNEAATAEYKAKRKAEDARRATVANRHGFNGTERNGYAVTTLAEGIS
jgi:hypothetical protein